MKVETTCARGNAVLSSLAWFCRDHDVESRGGVKKDDGEEQSGQIHLGSISVGSSDLGGVMVRYWDKTLSLASPMP